MSGTKYCARHRSTETNLECGRCGDPVCPRCLVHGPVGVRCPNCAQVRRLPTFDVTGTYLARAIGASLGIGIAGGVLFALISPYLFQVPYLSLFAFVGIGYLVGEGTSLAVNRKRGRSLKLVAAGGMLAAYLIVFIFAVVDPVFSHGLFGLVAAGAAFYAAIGRL